MIDNPEVQKTAEFVLKFTKFFDSLSVSCFEAGKRSRNPFKNPYHSESDFRIKVLSVYLFVSNQS